MWLVVIFCGLLLVFRIFQNLLGGSVWWPFAPSMLVPTIGLLVCSCHRGRDLAGFSCSSLFFGTLCAYRAFFLCCQTSCGPFLVRHAIPLSLPDVSPRRDSRCVDESGFARRFLRCCDYASSFFFPETLISLPFRFVV